MHRDSVRPDYQSRCRVRGVQELEFHRVKRKRPGRDQTSEALPEVTRSDLDRRQQRRVIEDANEDCQSAPDAIVDQGNDIRPPIPRNIE